MPDEKDVENQIDSVTVNQRTDKGSDLTVLAANRQAFVARLREAFGADGPYIWGRKIGTNANTIKKWLSGQTEPGMQSLIALSGATGFAIEWLATGRGPKRAGDTVGGEQVPTKPVDAELMARLTDGISRAYKDLGSRVSPADAVRIAAPEYEKILTLTNDQAERLVMVKLAVENVRRELQAANDAASRKQQG